MGRSNAKKNRRNKLFDEDPCCYWCGEETINIHPNTPEYKALNLKEPLWNETTLEHLRTRLDDDRDEPNPDGEERTVIACRRCNEERSNLQVRQLPITELWERSNNRPSFPMDFISMVRRNIRNRSQNQEFEYNR
jgi:hypothetical protein